MKESIDLIDIIPDLWRVQNRIYSAYSGMRFCWDNPKCYTEQEKKYNCFNNEKERLLKPIFGV